MGRLERRNREWEIYKRRGEEVGEEIEISGAAWVPFSYSSRKFLETARLDLQVGRMNQELKYKQLSVD